MSRRPPVPAPAVPARSRFGRFWRDDLGRIVKMDTAAEELLGFREEELAYEDATEQVHPEHRENAFENWIETLSSPGIPRRWRCRYRSSDGHRWVEITNTNYLADPAHNLVLSEMMDISEEMEATERLRQREELLQRLAASLPSGILQVDVDRAVVYANSRLQEIVGVELSPTLTEQFQTAVDEDRVRLVDAVDRVTRSGEPEDLSLRVEHGDNGRRRVCQLRLRALHDSGGRATGVLITVEDVTEATELRIELEQRANLDQLTGCENRGATLSALQGLLRRPGRGGPGTSVVFIDLDKFKPVNDQLGHAAGDEVLVAAAERLREAVRGGDLVGRIGGDEFLIVCPGVGDATVAQLVAERVLEHLCGPLTLSSGDEVDLAASAGVAWSLHDGITAEQLIARADEAMYDAKRRRDGRPVLVDELVP